MPRLTLDDFHARGFDRSAHTFGRPNLISVACSQCQSLVVNGTATHERGCPNAMHECNGCNALVPMRVRYCEDCA
jgi:hypothetical protein